MDENPRLLTIACALVGATPVALWWLIGDLTSPGFPDSKLDYAFRAPHPPPAVSNASGLLATVVVVIGAALLGRERFRGRITAGWLATPVLLCTAGALLAFGGRVMTAGGIGANIGAGLFVLFGLPAVLGLVMAATANAWRERRR
jgi:hypothetical protein